LATVVTLLVVPAGYLILQDIARIAGRDAADTEPVGGEV
jgi:hypothetical protein